LPEFQKADALKIAEEDKKTGILQNDWKKLESAAKIFRFHNEEKSAIECDAKANEFKGQYEVAGDLYCKIEPENDKVQTLRCYFIAGCFQKILDIKNQKDNDYFWFADLMQNKKFYVQLIEKINNLFNERFKNQLSWKSKFFGQLEDVLKNRINDFSKSDCKTIAEKLTKTQIDKFDNIIARYFFKAGENIHATSCWERFFGDNEIKPDDYYYAKIETTENPEDKIYYYEKIKDSSNRLKH